MCVISGLFLGWTQSLPGDFSSLWGCQATPGSYYARWRKSQTHNIPVFVHIDLENVNSVSFLTAHLFVCPSRWEEALSDCIWAQKHMRGNAVIDYRQLGLRFKLYSWQVWHSASHIHTAPHTCIHRGKYQPSACFFWHITKRRSSPMRSFGTEE